MKNILVDRRIIFFSLYDPNPFAKRLIYLVDCFDNSVVVFPRK